MSDDGPECPRGHPATSEGYCSIESCPYHFSKRHDGIGHGH